MSQNIIQAIEAFAEPFMVTIGHDYKHIDRVRNWGLLIARQEGFEDLEAVEAAALLHDIGLRDGGSREHAQVGAKLAGEFLRTHTRFHESRITEIENAIRFHSSLDGKGRLLEILQDADGLELFGAIGLMRAMTSKATLPEYELSHPKGETWGLNAGTFTQRFKAGVGIGPCIVDQINFQISCYDNLHTQTARRIAEPMVNFMRSFMQHMESEILHEVI